MSLVVGEHVSKSYGDANVLVNASFTLAADESVGLVGPNGEGKTTLLKIVAGMLEPTEGVVQRRRDLRIGYLPQDPPRLEGTTLWECLLEVRADLLEMEHQLHDLAGRLDSDQAIERYGQLQTRFEAMGGYDYENRLKTVLTGLGFSTEQWAQPLGQLSGGQCSRAMLARLLMEEPELLLLDEPTNHLDLASVEWLERFLQSYGQTLLVVSHDRYFLDKVTTRTWEVAFGALEIYRGAYTEFLDKREQRYAERLRQWESQQEYIAATEDFIRRNLAGQRTKEAQGRRTRLERFKKTRAIPKPQVHETIHIRLSPSTRTGDLVLRTENLQAGYEPGRPIVSAGDLEVRAKERLAILGGNGSGKTTLLRTVLGSLEPLAGKLQWGSNVVLGYLSQTHESLRGEDTVVESLTKPPYALTTPAARDLLGMFHFRGDDVLKRISELSGGQRSRVMLAQVSALGANVLLLDEPTNHLDLPSREILQETLAEFPGTVIFVSHDRYLVQGLATDIWHVEDGRVHPVGGGWQEYLSWRTRHQGGTGETSRPEDAEKLARKQDYEQTKRDRRAAERARRRLRQVEKQITELEQRLEQLGDEITSAGETGDMDALHRLGEEYRAVEDELTARMEEWEQLGEQVENA